MPDRRRELKTIEQAVTDTITKTVDRTLPPLAAGRDRCLARGSQQL